MKTLIVFLYCLIGNSGYDGLGPKLPNRTTDGVQGWGPPPPVNKGVPRLR